MKNFLKITLIAFLILGSYTFADNAEETPLQSPSAGLDEIAKGMASLFPKVEGKVLSVEENTIGIDIGTRNGILPQMRLTIFREGEEFFHPITKAVMGRFEINLGLLEIKEVMEETSVGLILEGREGIKTGDKVRITSGRIRMAVVLAEGVDKDKVGAFYEALETTGRFRVIEDEKVKASMGKEGFKTLESKDVIKRLGKTLDVEGMVFLEIRPTPKGPFLKADLLHTFDGKSLGTYEAFIPFFEKKDIELPLPVRKDYWKAFDFNYKARLLGVGDLDGDGRREIVISDGARLRIYRFEGSDLSEIWADKDNYTDNHIALDVADINRDGKAEVFVTNYGDSLRSFVIEYRDGGYKRIWDKVPLFFRVLTIPKKGETLIAQGLEGDIFEYSSKEGEYIKGNSLKLPLTGSGVDIYGFTFVDWERKGFYQILFIDEDDYLNLQGLDGEKIWKSKERYGGYALYYERPHWIVEGKMEKVMVKGRIIIKMAEDRTEMAILIRNIPITYLFREFRGYREAEVICLSWNGSEMIGEWRVGKIDGFIADYGVGDITNTGKENLFLLMNPTLMAGKSILMPGLWDVISGKSRLILYHLPKR
jgi:hypothetical protein